MFTHENRVYIAGTRKSTLAMWQTSHVIELLRELVPEIALEVEPIITRGDLSQKEDKPLPLIGGKGLFTAEIEQALLDRRIDFAVHSLKDLPTANQEEFSLAAICQRGPAADVLVSKGDLSLMQLPQGVTIGTSSLRRSAQLLQLRPDLKTVSLRGNVGTRISKLDSCSLALSGILLAQAGLERLGLRHRASYVLTDQEMLPAPGQGAIAVQCRSEDKQLLELLALIDHPGTRAEVGCERAFLHHLNAGCNTPVAGRAYLLDSEISFWGRCLTIDGRKMIEVKGSAPASDYYHLGIEMAERIISKGYPLE